MEARFYFEKKLKNAQMVFTTNDNIISGYTKRRREMEEKYITSHHNTSHH